MHPNAFLTTLWRAEVQDSVFVAMSFDPRFDKRFSEVMQPAIEAEPIAGLSLKAHRVDISKSGDSILTEIVSGIAHCRLVLADVSVIDEGRYTQIPIRNANVMYEVGIALASRTPSDVLVVRDDKKPLLFDLSTIPTLHLDYQDVGAIARLRAALSDRVREAALVNDARVQQAVRGLSPNELHVLRLLSGIPEGRAGDLSMAGTAHPSIPAERGVSGLLTKGFVRTVGMNSKTGGVFYSLTPLGRALASAADQLLRKLEPAVVQQESTDKGDGAA